MMAPPPPPPSPSVPPPPNRATKSTDNTVFVRFVPPSANVRRHHLEDVFSEIGPIKKSAVIHHHHNKKHNTNNNAAAAAAASYGFVKYTNDRDASHAAKLLSGREIRISADEVVQVRVEHAAAHTTTTAKQETMLHHHHHHHHPTSSSLSNNTMPRKKQNRLMLRNLSFYAKESHVRDALSRFGPLVEVHMPLVRGHARGFAFVTFENMTDAHACLKASAAAAAAAASASAASSDKDGIVIKDRPVQVSYALHKTAHEAQQQKLPPPPKNTSRQNVAKNNKAPPKDDEIANDVEKKDLSEDDDDDDDDSDDASSGSDENGDENDDDRDCSTQDDKSDKNRNDTDNAKHDKTAVAEQRSIFVRNLPFDATRHEVFEVFRRFGHVAAIYLVKDRVTGLPRGTAFVIFATAAAAQAAVVQGAAAAASSSPGMSTMADTATTTTTTTATATNAAAGATQPLPVAGAGGLLLKSRPLLVNLTVDKDTATALTVGPDKKLGKDKRHLYLQLEGRVDNVQGGHHHQAWDDLPARDQTKRQRAWSDKQVKLKSPLFFINPTRLSVRNLAQHVDEAALKRLAVHGIQRGLARVRDADQIAHWQARGDLTTRDMLHKVQDQQQQQQQQLVPPFDEKNIKRYIPSVFIDRDMGSNNGPNNNNTSRGFGFVEFTHHVHALACLRELNNNILYTADYVAGGQQAMLQLKSSNSSSSSSRQQQRKAKKKMKNNNNDNDDHDRAVLVRIPRLIVEFAVENTAKAQEQAGHRAQQEANRVKQKAEQRHQHEDALRKKRPKKSRGKLQREKKRQRKLVDEPLAAGGGGQQSVVR